MQLIGEMLDTTAKTYPQKDAVVFKDEILNYGDLIEKINRLALGLKKIGIGKGDRVMMQITNTLELVISHYAIIKVGAISIPLNVMYVAHEMSYIGKDTQAKAIIIERKFVPILKEVRKNLRFLKHIIVVGDAANENEILFDNLISDSAKIPIPYSAGVNDIVSIIYTSGTTGRPKGATQTHLSILSNVCSCCNFNKFNKNDKFLCALPLFNNFAINVVMMSAFHTGATLIVIDRFDAEKVLKNIKQHKATYFAGTPTMFVYLLQAFEPKKHDVKTLRVVNAGGAHCPSKVIDQVEEKFDAVFLDGYGQTEGCGFTTLNPIVGVRKQGSVGIPIANTWIKIIDNESNELDQNKVGEIVEKGDVFSIHGYWERAEINKITYRNGWFHSGDLGYIDEDGYLFVVDRKQDLIITGGANIYPVEVEEILYKHPAVEMCAVIGIPDEVKGELAKAYIVLKKGKKVTEDEIITYVRKKMAKYKAPRMVEFVESLPKGPTGKILKRELRQKIFKTPSD